VPRAALLAAALLVLAPDATANPPDSLAFARHGTPVAIHPLAQLREAVPARTLRVFDPYENRASEFRAFRFNEILDTAFTPSWRDGDELLFRCRDGYQPTVAVARFIAHDAWLAFARPGSSGFTILKHESGVEREIDLSPFYLVWDNEDDNSLRAEGDYGWPYQLVGVELIRARDHFPKMAPPAGATHEVEAGFGAFRRHCSRCHAINGEGGEIGPELNGPVPTVHVRSQGWLRRWIDDPSAILATARMPRFQYSLAGRAQVIDAILAYLEAIAAAKPPLATETQP
jgi:mono/diheme cytochrome c family protein